MVAGVVAAVVFAGLAGGYRNGGSAGAHPLQSRPALAPAAAEHSSVIAGPARPAGVSPTPVSPALATDLEARGHDLLLAGRYGAVVPVLKRAVLASGERLGACPEPASQACLTFAYALHDQVEPSG